MTAAIDEARRVAQHAANRAESGIPDRERCARELTVLRDLNPLYSNIAALDVDGRTLCSAEEFGDVGTPPWFQALARRGTTAISAPELQSGTGAWVVQLAASATTPEQALKGVGLVTLRLAAFHLPGPDSQAADADIGVVSRDGRVIARSRDTVSWVGRDVSAAPVGQAIMQRRADRGMLRSGDGTERLFAFVPIEGTDWVAVAGIPSARLRQAISRQQWRDASAVVAVLLLAGFCVWFIHRRLARPLEELKLAAQAVAAGDPTRRAVPAGPAETASVATAFNSMLDRMTQSEANLRASESRYRLLFETSPDAMRVICDGRIVMLNPAGVALFGFESEAVAQGVDIYETIDPAAHATVRTCLSRVAEEGAIIQNPELAFLRRDGSTVHAEVTLLPFVYEGRPAVLSVLHDLTRQKAAQLHIKRLAMAREALSRINGEVVRSTDWVTLCDAACRIVVEHGGLKVCLIRFLDAADGHLRRVARFGDRQGNFGSHPLPVADSLHPVARSFRDDQVLRVDDLAVESGFDERQRAWLEEEGVTWALFVPIRTEAGVSGTFSIFGDDAAPIDADFETLIAEISAVLGFAYDKLKADARVRESEERFRALTAMASDWYWETDAEHRFTRITQQKDASAAQAPEDELIGRTRWDNGMFEYDPDAMARHRATLALHEPFRDLEVRRRDATGQVRVARVSGDPIFAANGRFVGYRGVGRDITEVRGESEARLAAERRYRILFDAMPAAIRVICDLKVVMANAGAIELFGCGDESATLGRDVFDTIAPEYHARAREWSRAVIERGETVQTDDLEILRADGSRVWVDLLLHPFDFAGRPAVLSIVRDNTTRLAARKRILRLADMKDALSGTIEAMLREPDWQALCKQVCNIASERGRLAGAQIRMYNEATRSLDTYALSDGMSGPFGADSVPTDAPYSPSASVFRSASRLVANDIRQVDPGFIAPEARRMLERIQVRSYAVIPVRTRDKVIAVLAVLAREPGYFNDELCKVLEEMADDLGFAFDKARVEEDLAETEERYRRLVEASGNGIVVLDGTRIEFANPAFAHIVALASAEQAQGGDALDFVDPRDREVTRDNLHRLARGDVDALPTASRTLLTREGMTRIAQIAAVAIQIRGHRRTQVEMRDITIEQTALNEIQSLNRSLEQRVQQRTADLTKVNQDLEAFAYSVAHDLRAPLRAMNGFAQLLKLDLEEGSTATAGEHIGRIVQGTRHMGRLIDGLLQVARVSREIPVPESVDFNQLIEEVLRETDARARAQVEVGDLPTLRADATLMRQVWTNLVSNALKYGARAAQPRVRIECAREGDEFVFSIRDNGVGFNPAEAGHLFGLFQRLHPSSEFEGTGIGLTIVHRIVEGHGGRVWADATPGQGATFFVALPARLRVTTPST